MLNSFITLSLMMTCFPIDSFQNSNSVMSMIDPRESFKTASDTFKNLFDPTCYSSNKPLEFITNVTTLAILAVILATIAYYIHTDKLQLHEIPKQNWKLKSDDYMLAKKIGVMALFCGGMYLAGGAQATAKGAVSLLTNSGSMGWNIANVTLGPIMLLIALPSLYAGAKLIHELTTTKPSPAPALRSAS